MKKWQKKCLKQHKRIRQQHSIVNKVVSMNLPWTICFDEATPIDQAEWDKLSKHYESRESAYTEEERRRLLEGNFSSCGRKCAEEDCNIPALRDSNYCHYHDPRAAVEKYPNNPNY